MTLGLRTYDTGTELGRGGAMFAEQATSDLAGAGCSAVAVSYATSERLLRINNLAASLPPPLPSVVTARGNQWRSGSAQRSVKREQRECGNLNGKNSRIEQ